MEKSSKILSDMIVHMKYAKYLPEKQRRETWNELVSRNKEMHIRKFPELRSDINKAYALVYDKKILPSMRSLQFGGKPIEINPSRINNCAYLPVDSWEAFNETMFLLLGGSGVGYSVQMHHVEQLPEVVGPHKKKVKRYLIADCIEGWADAIKMLMKSYFFGGPRIKFDYSDIRAKGMRLITSGGKAPGPQPLKECIVKIKGILEDAKVNGKLSTIQCHDIMCHIADAVLSGGIRRAAMISFFSLRDDEMFAAKVGNWWETNPQRGRANNSVVLVRSRIKKEDFERAFSFMQSSGSGEPGIYFTNDKDMLANPCFIGSTKIETESGPQKLEDLVSCNNIKLRNLHGELVDGNVWVSGIKETVVVKTRVGTEIECTPDHVFLTTQNCEVQAKDLKGHRLMPGLYNEIDFDKLYTKLGFIQGDGCLSRLNSETHKGIEINFGKKDKDVLDLFDYQTKARTVYSTEFTEVLKKIQVSQSVLPERTLPRTYNSWSDVQKLSFLRGMWSANGSVIKNTRVAFKSTCKHLVHELQEKLADFGIVSYITTNKPKKIKFSNGEYLCKESYDLNIHKYDSILLFYKKIGFVHNYKTEALKEVLYSRSPIVSSVKYTGEKKKVYDFSVSSEDHFGIIENVIAHNCVEIGLKPYSFCNLTEINSATVESQEDLNERSKWASFIGTLQASYTDFHYLRDIWKENTEKDALIGVSLTGIASNSLNGLNLEEAASIAVDANKEYAAKIGINPAKRVTTVKPAGTSSIVLGCSSGIHAWHSKYYIRRIRLSKNESVYKYLEKNHPQLLEDDFFRPHDTSILSVPQKAPNNATTREEDMLEFLDRVSNVYNKWVLPGHTDGPNTNNVSATVSVKEDEWDALEKWLWTNRKSFNGISILPWDGGSYRQAPFEECSKYMYDKMFATLENVDFSKIKEEEDNTDLKGEIACGGGACEIK